MSRWLDVCKAVEGGVCSWYLRRNWCDGVQSVQRRLRVPRGIVVTDTAECDMPGWQVQHKRRRVVHRLRWRVCVSGRLCDIESCGSDVS
jgi:hypothetical protein